MPDGELSKADSTGMFVFTHDGHASVQVMARNPPPPSATESDHYSQAGYEATFGMPRSMRPLTRSRFMSRVRWCATSFGKDLSRSFVLLGDQLVVKSSRPEEHWKVIGRHY